MKIFHAKNQADAAEAAGEAVNDFIREHKKNNVLLLLSGGSALEVSDYISPELLDENLTVSVADERFTAEPEVNNFALLQNTSFYELAKEKDASFIGTLPRPGETLTQISQRYEKALRTWSKENPSGKVAAVLGMGPDGHTAGIFPLPDEETKFNRLFLSENWIAGYDNGGQKPPRERFTTTLSFFSHIDRGIIFLAGKEKKPALEEVLKNHSSPHILPALGWYKIKSAEIFTDIE